MDTNCKICGTATEELYDSQLKVTYNACRKCDFISKQKVFHLDYDTEKSRYDEHNNADGDEGYLNMFRKFIDLHVRPLKNVKNVLEFGSGPYPQLKIMLEEEGYQVFDFDPFYNPNTDYLNHKYDLITSTEVFEHLSDPIKEIEQLLTLLNDDGCFVIMTNFRLMEVEEFTNWWYRRDPTHISFFNTKTFEYIANKYNMEIIRNNGKNIITLEKK